MKKTGLVNFEDTWRLASELPNAINPMPLPLPIEISDAIATIQWFMTKAMEAGATIDEALKQALEAAGKVTDAAADAKLAAAAANWARYWAGHVPTEIPPSIISAQGLTGQHFSARYWAERAEGAFGSLSALYIGVHPNHATATASKPPGTLLVGSIYYNSASQQPFVWDGATWHQFWQPQVAMAATLHYRSAPGQNAQRLDVGDLFGHSYRLNGVAPEPVAVHVNGLLLQPSRATPPVMGEYAVNAATNTLTFTQPLAADALITVDILTPPAQISHGLVQILPVQDINVDPTTNAPGRQDGTRTAFSLVVAATGAPLAMTNPEELLVSVDGVIQHPGRDYTVNADAIQFLAAPAADARVWINWYVPAAGAGAGRGVADPAAPDDTHLGSYEWVPGTGMAWVDDRGSYRVVATRAERDALRDPEDLVVGAMVVEQDTGERSIYMGGGVWFGLMPQMADDRYPQTLTYDQTVDPLSLTWRDERDRVEIVRNVNDLWTTLPPSHLCEDKLVFVHAVGRLFRFTGDPANPPTTRAEGLAQWQAVTQTIQVAETESNLPDPGVRPVSHGDTWLVANDMAGHPLHRLYVWDDNALGPGQGYWRTVNTRNWIKATAGAPDQASGTQHGDFQATTEHGHKELKVFDNAASDWVDLFTEDEIRAWIAALSLFEGTLEQVGGTEAGTINLLELPDLFKMERERDLSKVSHYWIWQGDDRYPIYNTVAEAAAHPNWVALTATGAPAANGRYTVTLNSGGRQLAVGRVVSLLIHSIVGGQGTTVPVNILATATDSDTSIAAKIAAAWPPNGGGLTCAVAGTTLTFAPVVGTTVIEPHAWYDGGTPSIGSALNGAILNKGDWLQIANRGTAANPDLEWVRVGGDLMTRQRWGNLTVVQWVAGAFERGTIAVFDGHLYRASRDITVLDPAPRPGNIVLRFPVAAWPDTNMLTGNLLDQLPLGGNDGDMVRATAAGNSPGGQAWPDSGRYAANDWFVYSSNPAVAGTGTTLDGYPYDQGWIKLGQMPQPQPAFISVTLPPPPSPWQLIPLAGGVLTVAADVNLPTANVDNGALYLVIASAAAGGGPRLVMWKDSTHTWVPISGGGVKSVANVAALPTTQIADGEIRLVVDKGAPHHKSGFYRWDATAAAWTEICCAIPLQMSGGDRVYPDVIEFVNTAPAKPYPGQIYWRRDGAFSQYPPQAWDGTHWRLLTGWSWNDTDQGMMIPGYFSKAPGAYAPNDAIYLAAQYYGVWKQLFARKGNTGDWKPLRQTLNGAHNVYRHFTANWSADIYASDISFCDVAVIDGDTIDASLMATIKSTAAAGTWSQGRAELLIDGTVVDSRYIEITQGQSYGLALRGLATIHADKSAHVLWRVSGFSHSIQIRDAQLVATVIGTN